MNLSDYSKMPRGKGNSGNGEFLKWTTDGEVKVLRFLYTSNDGADIAVRRKIWDDVQKKFIYDTPEGKLTCSLNAVLYEKDGNGNITAKKVRWERSAAFTEQVCNGYWSKFPRIIDGVWEVTCMNPGTTEIKFSWFPVMGADFTKYPLPEGISLVDSQLVDSEASISNNSENSPVTVREEPPVTTSRTTKYWE